ncbi:MAG: hypothetical protein ACMXYK_05135 [Candidatus Woesearchaeota archaeon]
MLCKNLQKTPCYNKHLYKSLTFLRTMRDAKNERKSLETDISINLILEG